MQTYVAYFQQVNTYLLSLMPEDILLKDTSSKSLMMELESIFSRHDYPLTLKTDNGPNLVSVEMQNYVLKESVMQNWQLIDQEVMEK